MFYNLLLRDVCEIFFYSSCIFMLCRWLLADKSKPLMIYFLGYCLLCISTWVLAFPTLSSFLLNNAPIAILLFIVLHEKTLQRNFITLSDTSSSQRMSSDWLNTIMQVCLTSINSSKAITIIIEQRDSLEPFLHNPMAINAQISKNLLDILLLHDLYNSEKMVWIDINNRIKGINSSWITPNKQHKENALFYTLQNDAIILIANPLLRNFMLIHNGAATENLSAYNAQILLKKYLNIPHSRKGIASENNSDEKFIL